MKTVLVELWGGQVRGAGPNHATRIARIPRALAVDPRALFERAYPAFADRGRAVDEPGLALVAIDEATGAAAGMACVRARVDRYVTAIVGRHDRCDLYLEGHAALALRQLAIVLAPVRDWRAGSREVSYRVLDLRTAEGMIDERGHALRGLRCEGPAIVRCGGYAIYMLPLGDPSDWPDTGADAWAYLPERVYFDELARPAEGSVMRALAAPRRGQTLVIRTAGPRDTGMPLASRDDVAAQLVVRGPGGPRAIDVGHQALREGVLLGRYARCDGAGRGDDGALSRVHALLLRVDERLLAIDLASTNGTRLAGQADARVLELDGEAELELGFDTVVRWRWVS